MTGLGHECFIISLFGARCVLMRCDAQISGRTECRALWYVTVQYSEPSEL